MSRLGLPEAEKNLAKHKKQYRNRMKFLVKVQRTKE